jgi:hypothetical protein
MVAAAHYRICICEVRTALIWSNFMGSLQLNIFFTLLFEAPLSVVP